MKSIRETFNDEVNKALPTKMTQSILLNMFNSYYFLFTLRVFAHFYYQF